MAKRAAGTRALVHVLRPNKTKPAGPVKRARRKVKKARGSFVRASKRGKGRTAARIVLRSPLYTAKAGSKVGGAGARAVGSRMTPRVRKRTIVLRSAGGRFAGSRSV